MIVCFLSGMLTPAIRAMFLYSCFAQKGADSTSNEGIAACVLALTLLMARISAKNADDAMTADDLAVAADFLDGCADFHGKLSAT